MGDWKHFFKGKRVTVMGLGLLGRGLGDAIFLAEHGAELIVTDLRDEKTLAPSLEKLKKYKNIRYTLGQHKLEDFRNRPKAYGDARGPDFILKAAGVALDSPYIAEARKHGIPIEMDASLFAKLMPKGVTLVGVTGTRGKSTVTALIHEILKEGFKIYDLRFKNKKRPRVFKGGNLVPEATLSLLKKVRAGDIVVLELDSWQLQGFHDAKLSPHIAVFTTFLDDHLVYYKGDPKAPAALGHARKRYFEDKIAIFKYQKAGDVLIAGERVARIISSRFNLKSGKRLNLKSRMIVTHADDDVPGDWKIPLLGEHNLENIACALAVAKYFHIPESAVKKAIEDFKPVSGRLEYLHTVRGVAIYNDNSATTPDATIAALRALNPKSQAPNPKQIPASKSLNAKRSTLNAEAKRVILIMGGTDKGLNMSKLVAEIPKHCKAVILLRETGMEKFLSEIPLNKGGAESARRGLFILKDTLKECVEEAMKIAERGDIVLFSPAFASFGKWFKNEYDRGTQFVELVTKIRD